MQKKYLITSALLYANGPLHFGHIAGAYLPADCFARFQRLVGSEVLFISGSDEYGFAITLSAELAGRSPKEHVDLFDGINRKVFERLGFSFDNFSRTTWKGHEKPVQEFFLELHQNGFIEERVTDQLYSEKDQRFLADRYVEGTCPKCGDKNARGDECLACGASYEAIDLLNPRSKVSQAPLIKKATKHWYLRFDLFKEKLQDWIKTKDWKSNVLNFIQNYIDDLRPRAITRDSDWGIPLPLPGTEGKVLYVWFDAPIGYISATMEWAERQGKPEAWKDFWLDPKTELVNFIGKDNIPFHAVFFPAMCMGQNQPFKLVDELPANEFLSLQGKQFSKSNNWSIDIEEFLESFSADQIRYTLACNAPETSDSEFTWDDFLIRCNSELVGKFGNFVNRCFVFIKKHCNQKVPEKGDLSTEDHDFLKEIKSLADQAKSAYESFHLRKACQIMMELAQKGNVYFDRKKPWIEVKEDPKKMHTTLFCCVECMKLLALVSSPVVVQASAKLLSMLGLETQGMNWNELLSFEFTTGKGLSTPEILFSKVEDAAIEAEKQKLQEKLKN